TAAQTIAPHALEAHMRFLADDLLEGRETGTRGFDIAAEYVSAQFSAMGLAVSMQPIAFRSSIIREQSMRVNGTELVARKDFVISPAYDTAVIDASGPVALAGYGIVAPDAGHDDYKLVDVRGRIVMVLSGAPASFATDQRAYYSGTALKQRVAAEHGAIGLLIVNSRSDERRSPFDRAASQAP